MKKYKNKDGIELNYTGSDYHQQLVREVVSEAVKMLEFAPSYKGWEKANTKCKKFLRINFNIGDK